MHRPQTEAEFRARFPFHYEHEVEFRELDMLRHVNNVRYGEWAETSRARYFDDVMQVSFFERISVIIARHDMHYDAPVAARERVLIGGGVERIGTKSFDYLTCVWSLATERTVFRSTATLVAYDYGANASIVVPAGWCERVAAFAPPADA